MTAVFIAQEGLTFDPCNVRALSHSTWTMAIWGDEETLKLIDIWGEDAIQAMLEGNKRNKDVFKKIAGKSVLTSIIVKQSKIIVEKLTPYT